MSRRSSVAEIGAALLAGFCPGPAVVALATGAPKAFIFAGAMLAGMVLYDKAL